MKVMLIRTNKLLANFSSTKTFQRKNGKNFKIIKVDKFKFKFKINEMKTARKLWKIGK